MLMPTQKDAPDVLFMASYLEDAILLVKKIDELQIKSLLCGGAGGFTHHDFSRRTGNASESMLKATLWSPSNKDLRPRGFSDRFMKRHSQKPDFHAAEAYSALMMVCDRTILE
jgi:branched-chain amino acid transport system substrate-binding protein